MLKGYKTFILNGFAAFSIVLMMIWPGAELPSADQVGEVIDKTDALLSQGQALFGLVLTLGNMVLRVITSTPVFSARAAPATIRSQSPVWVGITALFVALVLTGCSANPFKVAETPEQKYLATVGTYNIVLESARDIVANPATPLSAVQKIDDVQKRTTPIMDSLDQAFVGFMVAKAELATGETTQDKLNIASVNLANWVDQAMKSYRELAKALE